MPNHHHHSAKLSVNKAVEETDLNFDNILSLCDQQQDSGGPQAVQPVQVNNKGVNVRLAKVVSSLIEKLETYNAQLKRIAEFAPKYDSRYIISKD